MAGALLRALRHLTIGIRLVDIQSPESTNALSGDFAEQNVYTKGGLCRISKINEFACLRGLSAL